MAPFAEALPGVEGCLRQVRVSGFDLHFGGVEWSSSPKACTPGRPSRG